MKTKEEIEQLAESQYGTEIGSIRGSNPYDLEKDRKNGFIKGYTQCQEDQSDKKYTEENMQEYAEFCIRCYEKKLPCIIAKDWFEQFKNKQD